MTRHESVAAALAAYDGRGGTGACRPAYVTLEAGLRLEAWIDRADDDGAACRGTAPYAECAPDAEDPRGQSAAVSPVPDTVVIEIVDTPPAGA